MRFPFEVPFDQVIADLQSYVSVIFSSLESEFLILPKGEGFIEYSVFEAGYEALKRSTVGFTSITPTVLFQAAVESPICLIVLRTILGFTPSEWGYIASRRTGVEVSQGFARALDRKIRIAPLRPFSRGRATVERIHALVDAACELLSEAVLQSEPGKVHRLGKPDTNMGWESIRTMAGLGAPYAMLLCERFLGRPFAGHRDSVSELMGDSLESAIEDVLSQGGLRFRKTKRAERVPGFDQAPDFIIPSEFNPLIVIEAKITEDDGTARDKVTRIQHLGELRMMGQQSGQPKFEVVACIGGRGFGIRRSNMRKLLYASRGKVFTLRTLDKLITHSRLEEFKTR